MIILYPNGQSPSFLGQHPKNVSIGWIGNGIAPHANTSRVSYTVPAGKRALIQACLGTTIRDTVAAPIGRFGLFVERDDGVSPDTILSLTSLANTIGANNQLSYADQSYMKAGDIVTIWTGDLSTGGTVSYFAHVSITEFDE